MAFFLVPQFPMLAFASAIEPLRAANRLSGRQIFEWILVSLDGNPVAASNGIAIAVHGPLVQLSKVDIVLVCAGLEPTQFGRSPKVCHPLRRLARHGSIVGAISSGSFILADAGLLAGRRSTVHWEYADAFRLRHPDLKVTQELYVVDRDVFTCSGGTAALDLMLRFVSEAAGPEIAVAVAEQFIHPRIRKQEDQQRLDLHARYGVDSPTLIDVIRFMEDALEEPLDVREIARRLDVSTRQIERLFRVHLDSSPKAFYLNLRLARARTLLRHTLNPLRAIYLECGFASTSHFSHAYKRVYGIPPTHERAKKR
jgi:AraC family transcriptional regulator, glycine betaine-responsive activator